MTRRRDIRSRRNRSFEYYMLTMINGTRVRVIQAGGGVTPKVMSIRQISQIADIHWLIASTEAIYDHR